MALEVEAASLDDQSLDLRGKYQSLVGKVEAVKRRMLDGKEPVVPPVLQMTVALLASLYERLGEKQKAYDELTFAMRLEKSKSETAALFAYRGSLFFPEERGVSDLEEAIRLDIRDTWPYLRLAKHYLDCRQFQRSLDVSNAGIARIGNARAKSELLELSAIVLAGLGMQHEVLERFKQAIETDPTNERAKYNLSVYQVAVERSVKYPEKHREFEWQRIPDEYFEQIERKERQKLMVHVYN